MSENKAVWYKYPDERPKIGGWYNVTVVTLGLIYVGLCKCKDNGHFKEGIFSKVLAWAELPDPYKGQIYD